MYDADGRRRRRVFEFHRYPSPSSEQTPLPEDREVREPHAPVHPSPEICFVNQK